MEPLLRLAGFALGLVLWAAPAWAAPPAWGVLDRFVGIWAVTGTTLGHPADTGAEVRPAFGGAFLELHVKDPKAKDAYEARVFFGQDAGGRVVVHWLDRTGGEYSRTLGAGQLTPDGARLVFPYPDGDFRDALTYDPAHDRWRLLIETGPKDKPQVFSDWWFDRVR
jgi:hypothetical protein